jgi:hypothetical protein
MPAAARHLRFVLAALLLGRWAAAHAGRAATTFARIYPDGAPPRVRHLRGRPNRPLTFGFEAEFKVAKTPGLLDWYRNANRSDEEWADLTPEERTLQAGDGVGLVPTSSAPRFLDGELERDAGGAEFVTKPIRTLETAFNHLATVERAVGGDGERRSKTLYWQANAVNTRDPGFVRRERDGMLGYIKATADYAQLRKLHEGYLEHLREPSFIPGRNLRHVALAPISAEIVRMEHRELDAAEVGRWSGASSHHLQGTVFRTWGYGEGRDGFEIRDAHKDVAHLKQEMRRQTHALEHGFGAYRRFRFIRPLDEAHFEALSPRVRALLAVAFTHKYTSSLRMEVRYALPMRPLEHDYARALRMDDAAAAALRQRVAAARAEYVATLERLALDPPTAEGPQEARDAVHDQVGIALGKFAYQTGLYPMLDEAFAEGAERIEAAPARRSR